MFKSIDTVQKILIVILLSAVFFAVYLSSLFKTRERRLSIQRDDLAQKTQTLTLQTHELTETKDWLHEALTKSDKARVELERTKKELENANLELKERIEELERFNKVTVGREIRMAELKDEIRNLREVVKKLQEKIPTK